MNCDVIIIGGGLGGLSAGTYLSRQGIDVILVEEQAQTGGYAIAYKKDAFVFDVALHAIPACAPGQPFFDLLSELDVIQNITFIKLKNAFNVNLGSYNFVIPNSYGDFFDKLHKAFPDERTGLNQLKTYLDKYAPLYFDVVEGRSDKLHIVTQFIPKIPDFIKMSQLSTEAFLSKYIRNERLKALLYQAAVFLGEPMSQFPAVNFIIMFYLLFKSGMYTIQNGGQALTNVLENKMLEHKAKIITNMSVKSIQIKNKTACGVSLSDGREIKAGVVLSNLNTPELVNRLIQPGVLPEAYLKTINTLKCSLSILQLHLGLNCSVEQIGIRHYLNIFFPDDNIDSTIKKQNSSAMIEGYSVLAPGINYTDKTSNAHNILSIVGGVSAKSWIGLNKSNYRNLKQQAVEQILNKIEKLLPEIREHIKTIDLATPHTFNRYTQNPGGAILGFKAEPGKHRSLLKISRFPIRNIYLAGAWTNRLGGFMQSIKAGIVAAQNAINYMNKVQ